MGDPTATDLGWMPLFQALTAFYRAHQDLYHAVRPSTDAATTSLGTPVMISVADQASPRRRLVHLVNHDYAGGLIEHDGFSLTVPVAGPPLSVTLASPDLGADVTLTSTYASGSATITIPSLVAYDVIEIAY